MTAAPDKERLEVSLFTRVTHGMKASVKELAKREGRTPADWLRRLVQRELDLEAGKRGGRR